MSRKRTGYILIGAGILLAFIVGIVVFSRLNWANSIIASQPKQQVVIANQPIPARTEIAASMVTIIRLPDEAVTVGATSKVEDVVGKFTPNDLLKGEIINVNRIGPASAKNAPSFQIEKGKVMYVMPLQLPGQQPFSILQVNALRPGDRVDFIYTSFSVPEGLPPAQLESLRESNAAQFLQTRFMLQNIRIQQVGMFDSSGQVVPGSTYMIMVVTPEEALVLKWLKDTAESFGNSIEMVLRSPGDDERVDPSLTINLNYMREKYGLAEPPRVVIE